VSSDVRPEFLTVEQAAAVIGIGRTCAYQLARRAADHGEGSFPAVRFGKQLRVPRRKLEALTGGPISLTTDEHQPPTFADHTIQSDQPPTTSDHDQHHRPIATTRPTSPIDTTTTTTDLDQPHLPFTTP